MSRDFIGALLQLNAEKGAPARAARAHRRGCHPERLPARRARLRGRLRQARHGDRRDAHLPRPHRRLGGRGRDHAVVHRRGPGARPDGACSATSSSTSSWSPRTSVASAPRSPGRSCASACARRSARRSSTSSRTARARSSPARVSRVEPSGVILDLGKAEAILRTTDQSATEHYRIGQHVKAYVLEVRRTHARSAHLRQPHPQGLPAPALRAGGAGDPGRHRGDPGHRPRGRQPQQDGRLQPPGGPRPGGRHRRPARRPRAGRRGGAGRREDRHHPLVGRPGRLRRQRPEPGPGRGRRDRRGEPHRLGHGARAHALAGHRPRGPERAAGRQADRLAHRHPIGERPPPRTGRRVGRAAPSRGRRRAGARARAADVEPAARPSPRRPRARGRGRPSRSPPEPARAEPEPRPAEAARRPRPPTSRRAEAERARRRARRPRRCSRSRRGGRRDATRPRRGPVSPAGRAATRPPSCGSCAGPMAASCSTATAAARAAAPTSAPTAPAGRWPCGAPRCSEPCAARCPTDLKIRLEQGDAARGPSHDRPRGSADDAGRHPWHVVAAAPADGAGPGSRASGPRARESAVQVADPATRGAVEIPDSITVKELAELIGINSADVIRELIRSGIFATINQTIDRDTAALVTEELGFQVVRGPSRRGSRGSG